MKWCNHSRVDHAASVNPIKKMPHSLIWFRQSLVWSYLDTPLLRFSAWTFQVMSHWQLTKHYTRDSINFLYDAYDTYICIYNVAYIISYTHIKHTYILLKLFSSYRWGLQEAGWLREKVTAEEQEGFKTLLFGRCRGNQFLLDMTGPLHSWTDNSCLSEIKSVNILALS